MGTQGPPQVWRQTQGPWLARKPKQTVALVMGAEEDAATIEKGFAVVAVVVIVVVVVVVIVVVASHWPCLSPTSSYNALSRCP